MLTTTRGLVSEAVLVVESADDALREPQVVAGRRLRDSRDGGDVKGAHPCGSAHAAGGEDDLWQEDHCVVCTCVEDAMSRVCGYEGEEKGGFL